MDFKFTDEQRMLKDSVERYVSEKYTFSVRGQSIFSSLGYSIQHWRLFAEMGWLALPFDERYGGVGGTAVDMAIVMKALGRGLVLEPYLSTVVVGGGLIQTAGSEAQKEQYIPQIIAGELTLAFAYLEPQSRFDATDIETTACRDDSGDKEVYCINGHKSVVYQGRSADKIIVSARTSGAVNDRDGISLFVIDQGSAGIQRRDTKTVDGQWASEFIFENVNVHESNRLGAEGGAIDTIEHVLEASVSALCAEAVGAMEAANEISKEYITVREQFGVTLSTFQVLQHRLVDMQIETEMAQSMSDVLAMHIRDRDALCSQVVSATKVCVGKAAEVVGQGAVQLHGGIGITDEYSIGHYYKRLMMIDILFGNRDYHCDRYERLSA
jgi:alkylation response protein AidB-like acyl-CoA dehydrogenase